MVHNNYIIPDLANRFLFIIAAGKTKTCSASSASKTGLRSVEMEGLILHFIGATWYSIRGKTETFVFSVLWTYSSYPLHNYTFAKKLTDKTNSKPTAEKKKRKRNIL